MIFSYKGKNLLINKDIRCKDDIYTHLYTLIVKPDNTYKVSGQKLHYKLPNMSSLESHVLIDDCGEWVLEELEEGRLSCLQIVY